jgi:hypothetical protein
MDQKPNHTSRKLLSEVLCSAGLVTILAYGVVIIALSQVSTPNYRSLAAIELNNFLCFVSLIAVYLTWTRMHKWKVLVPFSMIVAGFIFELVTRVQMI